MVTAYLMMMATFALIAICMFKDRSGIPLGPDHEAEQNQSPFIWK